MSERAATKKAPWYVSVFFILALILLSPILLIIGLVLFFPWLKSRLVQRPKLLLRVKNEWLPNNKFILFIYSDSEQWKEYAEKNIIPQIAPNAVILNWSERKNWINSNLLEVQLFRNFNVGAEWVWQQNSRMGGQSYNHIAIVFKPWHKPKAINFWKAFKNYQFGKTEDLKDAEAQLYSYLQ